MSVADVLLQILRKRKKGMRRIASPLCFLYFRASKKLSFAWSSQV